MTLPPAGAQLPLALRLDPGATFDSFHPGANRSALSQVRAAAAGPAWLYLWGAPGTGKTHLLNAACHAAGEAGRTACLVPLDRSDGWAPDALAGLQGIHLVCLDGVDALAGRREWEEALFHLLNGLREAGGSVLMAARGRPASMPVGLPDLRSRLGWGTLVRLKALEDDDKLAALKLRARQRGLDLSDEAAGYLIRRVARDTRTLFGLLDRLDSASLAAKRRLTVPFLREVLEESGLGAGGSDLENN